MTPEAVVDLGYRALNTALWCAMPILLVGMAVGLLIAVFQSATQIQEASLNFVPKLLGMAAALVVFGSLILERLQTFTTQLFTTIASLGGSGP